MDTPAAVSIVSLTEKVKQRFDQFLIFHIGRIFTVKLHIIQRRREAQDRKSIIEGNSHRDILIEKDLIFCIHPELSVSLEHRFPPFFLSFSLENGVSDAAASAVALAHTHAGPEGSVFCILVKIIAQIKTICKQSIRIALCIQIGRSVDFRDSCCEPLSRKAGIAA